jgi:hypothetical protein
MTVHDETLTRTGDMAQPRTPRICLIGYRLSGLAPSRGHAWPRVGTARRRHRRSRVHTWRRACTHPWTWQGRACRVFLGKEAPIGKGLRVALVAAFLDVLSGFAAFLILRLLIGQLPSISGRPLCVRR